MESGLGYNKVETDESTVAKAIFRLQKTAEHILAEGIEVEETANANTAKMTMNPKTEALLKETNSSFNHHQGKSSE